MRIRRLEYVIARAVAELRAEHGWTQHDLAWRLNALGAGWSANRVAQIETLRGRATLFEVMALCWVFEVSLGRLLNGDDEIESPNGQGSVPLDLVRQVMTGSPIAPTALEADPLPLPAPVESVIDFEEIRKIAKALGMRPQVLAYLAEQMWGRGFTAERDIRAGNLSGLTKRSAQTKRGHVTRALITEVRARVEVDGLAELVASYQREQLRRRAEHLAGSHWA
jgi:transcriptional regulator with XRE-family HTH domain